MPVENCKFITILDEIYIYHEDLHFSKYFEVLQSECEFDIYASKNSIFTRFLLLELPQYLTNLGA